ncbi:hypothetical protein Tco_0445354 [Tanacetum coccineum]
MDDPNMTMEEYIKLEEEKVPRRGQVFNWQTATYGKIRIDDNLHDLSSVDAEFPAIVTNDAFVPHDALQYKSQVKNDNEKVMPSIPSLEPTTNYIDDLDFFNDFVNEFPAIVYNDAPTSKSNLLIEPTFSPLHIDEFDLNNETSLSECDEKEQNVLYFNDLFPFNVIYHDDSKSDTNNDNDKIDIEQSSGNLSVIPLPNVINTDVGAYAQGTVYTTYSLNEYTVYMYQYGVSWGMDTAYQLPVQL